MKWQELGLHQGGSHFFIAIIPAALADILNIAPFKNPLYNEVGFGIIINLLKVYIPENTSVEYGPYFFIHNAKIIKEDGKMNYFTISDFSLGNTFSLKILPVFIYAAQRLFHESEKKSYRKGIVGVKFCQISLCIDSM